MRYVYEHRDEAVQKGKYAAEEAKNLWTWDAAADKIITRLNAIR